jgi:hypothetical protein
MTVTPVRPDSAADNGAQPAEPAAPPAAPRALRAQPNADDIAAAAAIQGANPFIGLTVGQVASAATRWAGALGRRPRVLVSEVLKWGGEEWPASRR